MICASYLNIEQLQYCVIILCVHVYSLRLVINVHPNSITFYISTSHHYTQHNGDPAQHWRSRYTNHRRASHPQNLLILRRRRLQPPTRRPPLLIRRPYSIPTAQRLLSEPKLRNPISKCKPPQEPLRPSSQRQGRTHHERLRLRCTRRRRQLFFRGKHVHGATSRTTPIHSTDIYTHDIYRFIVPGDCRSEPPA